MSGTAADVVVLVFFTFFLIDRFPDRWRAANEWVKRWLAKAKVNGVPDLIVVTLFFFFVYDRYPEHFKAAWEWMRQWFSP